MPVTGPHRHRWVRRHGAVVRVTHWINLACLAVLLPSGLQIFNAHPALYWGQASDFAHPLLSLGDGFPDWMTLPGEGWLAMGRRWHLAFAWLLVANGAAYLAWGLAGGHLWRDLVPSRADLAGIGRTIVHHLRLRFPKGAEAEHYNVLQKLAYLGVIAGLLPAMVLAGMAMSPGLDAALPWLLDLFGGRQSARTIHFAIAALLVAFVVVHVAMVVLSGPWNSLRSMITGRYAIDEEDDQHGP